MLIAAAYCWVSLQVRFADTQSHTVHRLSFALLDRDLGIPEESMTRCCSMESVTCAYALLLLPQLHLFACGPCLYSQ